MQIQEQILTYQIAFMLIHLGKIICVISILLLSTNSRAAGGPQLTGVKGTLKNVEIAIKSAVKTAENLFCEGGGSTLDTAYSILIGDRVNTPSGVEIISSGHRWHQGWGSSAIFSTSGLVTNPFLDMLIISSGTISYHIQIQFAGSFSTSFYESAATTGSIASVPVSQVLMGAKIELIPVYTQGDAQISSWECITDADTNAKAFIGSNIDVVEGNTSLISADGNNGYNEYLNNCIFSPSSLSF